jgi:hypothetical protein
VGVFVLVPKLRTWERTHAGAIPLRGLRRSSSRTDALGAMHSRRPPRSTASLLKFALQSPQIRNEGNFRIDTRNVGKHSGWQMKAKSVSEQNFGGISRCSTSFQLAPASENRGDIFSRSATPLRNALVLATPSFRPRAMELRPQARAEMEFRHENNRRRFEGNDRRFTGDHFVFPENGFSFLENDVSFPRTDFTLSENDFTFPANGFRFTRNRLWFTKNRFPGT